MNVKTNIPMLLLASLAGFVGGIASNPRLSLAQPGPTSIQFIRTQAIDVVDQAGKVRIRLATAPQTSAAAVSIFDTSHADPRIIVGTQADGTSNIQLQDENGHRRASFDYLSQGVVRLALVNSSSSGGMVLGSNDKSVLTFSDGNQKLRATFGLTSSGEPALAIYDGNGKVVWSAPPPKN